MNILYIGDIVGRPGRNAVKALLPQLKSELNLDLVLANGENLAGGLGMTLEKYREMIDVGIDYFTTGNHIWSKKDFIPHLDNPDIRVLRPANYPSPIAGRGSTIIEKNGKKIQLMNLIGKAFMHGEFDDYFTAVDKMLEVPADIRIIDFHAEATSEKIILGFYLDGRVTALLGTHTHVPTADERILPKGTAFQTDLGMTGPLNSSLGATLDLRLAAAKGDFEGRVPYEVASGPVVFNSTFLTIDDATNKATKIERIQRTYNP